MNRSKQWIHFQSENSSSSKKKKGKKQSSKNKKGKKKDSKAKVKEENEENGESSGKGKGKKKKEEEKPVWKWWEEKDQREEGTRWSFLEHNGPLFAPPYEPLPSDVNFNYNGKPMKLSEPAEEVAGFYGKMLDHGKVLKQR